MRTASFSNIHSGLKTGFTKHVFFQRLLLQVCNGVGPVLHYSRLANLYSSPSTSSTTATPAKIQRNEC